MVPCIAHYERLVAQLGQPMPSDVQAVAVAAAAMLSRWLHLAPPLVAAATGDDRHIWRQVAQASRWACESYVWAAQPQKSIAAALLGMELARALDDRELQSYFWVFFGYLAGLVPLHSVSRSFLARSSRLISELASPRAELDFHRIASARHMNAADWTLGVAQLEALIALARQLGDENALIFGLSARSITAFRQSDEPSFVRFGTELYDKARRHHNDQFARAYPLYRGIAALRRGEVESAQRLFAEAEFYIHKSKDSLGRIILGGLMARCLLLQGKPQDAQRRADETLALIETVQFSVESVGEGVSSVAEVYLELWEAGSVSERRQLDDRLRRSLSALRRCGQIFPSATPRAYLWHARVAVEPRGASAGAAAGRCRPAQRPAGPDSLRSRPGAPVAQSLCPDSARRTVRPVRLGRRAWRTAEVLRRQPHSFGVGGAGFLRGTARDKSGGTCASKSSPQIQ